jgi:hypothetical protein
MNIRGNLATLYLSGLSLGCGTAGQGTEPQDMSSAQHAAAAQGEESSAEKHADQYQADATQTVENCPTGKICWTTETNPTAEHQADAEQHRALAARHREASQALVQAEANACSGISDTDRDMSPLMHTADVASVGPLERQEQHGKNTQAHLAGATVVLRAVPGLTEQWLQRIVDCHLARNAALGVAPTDMPHCPLAVKGVSASVRALADGFAVDVQASDPKVAEQVLTRAQQLKAGG